MYFEEATDGDVLPPFSIPLTIQRLVMEAAVNRDFAPIHHDQVISRSTGAPDAYANTILVQAMFEATLREWMGLGGRLRKLAFTMRSFACAGRDLSGNAVVVSRAATDDGGTIDLEIWTESGGERAATGTATVWLPGRAA